MAIVKAPDELARLQASFAAHIRDPESVAAPEGIEDRRMGIYRELFFNNIRNFLSANFPVLKTLFDEKGWETLCRDFYSKFRCHTPLFPEIPREFLRYLQDNHDSCLDERPDIFYFPHRRSLTELDRRWRFAAGNPLPPSRATDGNERGQSRFGISDDLFDSEKSGFWQIVVHAGHLRFETDNLGLLRFYPALGSLRLE